MSRLKILLANTEKKRSAKTCKKISQSKTGIRMSEKTRDIMSVKRKEKSKSNEMRSRGCW